MGKGYKTKKIKPEIFEQENLVKAEFSEDTVKRLKELYQKVLLDKENYVLTFDKNIGEALETEKISEGFCSRLFRLIGGNDVLNDVVDLGGFLLSVVLNIFTYQHELTREAIAAVYKMLKAEQHGELIEYIDRFEQYQTSYNAFNEVQREAICHFMPEAYHTIGSLIETQKEQIKNQFAEKKLKRGTLDIQVDEYMELRSYYRLAHLLYCKATMIDMFYSNNFSREYVELKKQELKAKREGAFKFLTQYDQKIAAQLYGVNKKLLDKKEIEIAQIEDESEFLKLFDKHISSLEELAKIMRVNSIAMVGGELYINAV